MTDTNSRILIVEDEAIVAVDIQSQLEALGYTVLDIATSGEEAREKALDLCPDMVLMDIRLSGQMDGIDAAESIRRRHDIPIVFLTAYADQDTLQRAKAAGPHGYLVKPFNERDLYTAIEIALHKHQLENALRKNYHDLLTLLDAQRHGTVIIDAHGRIAFLSKSAQQLLNVNSHNALNRSWKSVLCLNGTDQARLEAMLQCPPDKRTKIPLRIPTGEHRADTLEIEIQNDPRAADQKILFLYDVSDLNTLRELLDSRWGFHRITGKSKAIQVTIQLVREIAPVDSTVLIEGETGTGKELVARTLHDVSQRQGRPFIALNCAGLSEQLATSQLFGHRRGSFTGAVGDQVGLFEAAQHGTLFLDEIGELPLSVQSVLLRVLEEKAVMRLGETRLRTIDVRFIAATNRDLAEEVAQNRFREDLFYRIRVARIHLAPLRERREDIAPLVRTFLAEHRATTGKRVENVSDAAMRLLLVYPWPGNVRELRNALEFAVIRCHASVIQPADLPPEVQAATLAHGSTNDHSPQEERGLILAALELAGGNRKEAATLLGVSRATLYRRLSEHGLGSECLQQRRHI